MRIKKSALLTLCALSVPALAQTTAQESKVSEEPQAENEIFEQIIVTAERRSTSLQTTGVAVTALSANQLEKRGISDVSGLQNVVPNLQVNSLTTGPGASSSAFYIRGLGQQRSANGSDPAVALYIDDFYYPSLSTKVLRTLDVAQVEVLRGPQGTLFGRNTIGGAIRYQTKQPDYALSGNVKATVGTFGKQEVSVALNTPVSDNLTMRWTAAYLKEDGFQDRANDKEKNGRSEDKFVRYQLKYEPSDKLNIDFSFDYAESEIYGFPVFIPTIEVMPRTAGFVYNIQMDPDYTQAFASPSFDTAYGGMPKNDFDESSASNIHLSIAYDLTDDLTLKLLSGATIVKDEHFNDIDATPLPVAGVLGKTEDKGMSHEIQLAGDISPDLHFVSGLYYYKEDSDALFGQELNVPPPMAPRIATRYAQRERNRTAYSVFTNITYDVTDKLSSSLGLRVGREEIDGWARPIAEGYPDIIVDADAAWDIVLPMAKLQYQWEKDLMTYASIAKGFRAGGFNTALNPELENNGVIPFDPEEVWTYEAGMRGDFLDGTFRFNPTVFYTDYDDIQVQRIPPGTTSAILDNGGKAHIYGVETEFQYRVSANLTLSGNVSYLKAKYDEIVEGTGILLTTPFARTPEWSGSISGEYFIELAQGAEMSVNLDYSYRTDQWTTPTESDHLLIDAYGLLNANITYTPASGDWYASLYATNLLDEEYVSGGVDLRQIVGNVRYDIGRPRELGLRVKYMF